MYSQTREKGTKTMKKEIWFDMDGTIADLYAVHNWLIYLECENPFPYENAMPMMNFSRLAKLLNKLQKNGWNVSFPSVFYYIFHGHYLENETSYLALYRKNHNFV